MCIQALPSVCQELKMEPYRIKHYAQERFKDITSLIKTRPILACASCLALAGAIYFAALPVFLTLSTMIMLDYLASTDFCRQSSFSGIRGPFFSLFWSLRELQLPPQPPPEPISLSSEDREKLTKDELELIDLFAGDDEKRLEEWKAKEEERKVYKEDHRSVVLFLRAKADHNGALINQDRAITMNGDNDAGILKLKEKYKIALIDNITHVDQIKEGLEKITNPIQQVWVFAHGSPTSMRLDHQYTIGIREIDELASLMQQKLSADAHVVLYSCSTGQKVASGKNIATKFSEILPGRTIWAPNVPTGIMTCDLGEDSSLKVNFWNNKSRLKYLKEKIWNICRLRPFKKIEVKLNVTTQTKDGLECFSAA